PDRMRWLVTGAKGMLGTDAVALFGDRGHDVVAVDLGDLELTDADAVKTALAEVDVVLNCAAWTAVDDAETQEDAALLVNATIPGVLAEAAAATGTRLVQISTDYVFAGDATSPYAEDAPAAPQSAYGRTKEAGERAVRAALPDAHLIVRTAWLYGAHGNCFPKTIARVAAERGALSVVDDQVGQPTWTHDVADLVLRLVEADAPAGTYHATSGGQTSWFGFAQRVVEAAGLDPAIVTPTDSQAFQRPAPRPAYSVLGHGALERLGIAPIGDWEERWARASVEVLGLA
ncbi:MAG TPA: dTDP-4-dehydrorhamnose reductase, partial [Marmoricola sp.]|nr:dTDP-4-dehydrorhamnose reductase [Marmoricola sp.]